MANYATLKAAVQAVVKTNGNKEITGANLQTVLLSIINSVGGGGYIFKGVATPSTSAGTPDENVFYIGAAGTYANFGSSITIPVGTIGVFKYNGSWTKEQVKLFDGIDTTPTMNSTNLITSGGVYDNLQTHLLNNRFIGKNNTFSTVKIIGLIPNRTYQLDLPVTNWDVSGVTITGAYRFAIDSYYNSNKTNLANIAIGNEQRSTFVFTVPEQSDYIEVGGRATQGTNVNFIITDLSYEKYKNLFWVRVVNGSGTSWIFDPIAGIKAGRTYRFVFPKQTWDETGIDGTARFQVQSVVNNTPNNLLSVGLPLNPYYDVTIPVVEGEQTVRAVFRIASGAVYYYVYDVTEIVKTQTNVDDLDKFVGFYFDGAATVTGSAWLVKYSCASGRTYKITGWANNAHSITTYLMTGTTSANRVQSIGTVSAGASISFTANQDSTYIGGYTQDSSVGVIIEEDNTLSADFYNFPQTIVDNSFNAAYHTGAQNWAAKCQTFTDLVNNSAAAESFLFFTDPHFFTRNNDVWKKRMPEFIAQIQKYYNSTPTSFCVSGGDWLTAQDSNSVAKFRLGYADGIMRSMFKNYYPMFGNHDDNYQGASTDGGTAATATPLETQTIINLWFREFGKAYYTFKGASSRFYVFDTGNDWSTSMTAYRWEQVDWFGQKLLVGDDEHIVILAHIAYNSASDVTSNTLFPITDNIAQMAQAYNGRTSITMNGITYDFSSATGEVEFILAGHVHADVSQTKYGLPIVCTINTMALTTEPSFDLVYADYVARKLYCIRIGSGNDRTINLA